MIQQRSTDVPLVAGLRTPPSRFPWVFPFSTRQSKVDETLAASGTCVAFCRAKDDPAGKLLLRAFLVSAR